MAVPERVEGTALDTVAFEAAGSESSEAGLAVGREEPVPEGVEGPLPGAEGVCAVASAVWVVGKDEAGKE